MISKNKNLFLKIYILFVIIISVALIILQILGSKNRIGYLTDFKLNVYKTLELNNLENINNELDEEGLKNFILNNENITNYIYQFRIRYYDKVFRNSDIYGVYPDLSNLPDYMENAEMEKGGSPYGNFISDRKTIEEEKIDNVSYTLKVNEELVLLIIIFILLVFMFMFMFIDILNKTTPILLLLKYRFFIAGIIFILCLIFEISGSSISTWNYALKTDSNVIFGISRGIRSDEHTVLTPLILSQYKNHTGKFTYFSDTVRADKTDMNMVYATPIKDISIIFRIFYIGFLFLSPEKGMSFFWFGRLILLFLVSFEIMKLVTNRNYKLSFLGCMLVSFAPILHWWFAINFLFEMLIFSFLTIIFFNLYVKDNRILYKSLYILLILIFLGNFLFAFYPAWQIPTGYLLLSFIIWIILENYKKINIDKKDLIVFSIFFIIFMILVLRIFIKSKETLEIIMNTTYPGKRFETGGKELLSLFRYPINLFTSYIEHSSIRADGVSSFIDLFPIPYVLSTYLIIKEKIKDRLNIILLLCSLFLGLYIIIGYPKLISKISLLYVSPSYRTTVIFGLINIFLLIRCIYLYNLYNIKFNNKFVLYVSFLLTLLIITLLYKQYNEYLKFIMIIILFYFLFFIFYSLFLYNNNNIYKNIFIIMISFFLIVSSIYINPIQKGLDVIYSSELYNEVNEISSNDKDAIWISEGNWWNGTGFHGDILIMAGAPTVNSINCYPNLNRWKIIDPELKYKNIYNQYAHIFIYIVNSNDNIYKFEKIIFDHIAINLTPQDLLKLNVKYIVTFKELEQYNIDNIQFKRIKYHTNYFSIYEIISNN